MCGVLQDFGSISFQVSAKCAHPLTVMKQLAQAAAWNHDCRRKSAHLDVALITKDQSCISIEHQDALRHVVKHGSVRLSLVPPVAN